MDQHIGITALEGLERTLKSCNAGQVFAAACRRPTASLWTAVALTVAMQLVTRLAATSPRTGTKDDAIECSLRCLRLWPFLPVASRPGAYRRAIRSVFSAVTLCSDCFMTKATIPAIRYSIPAVLCMSSTGWPRLPTCAGGATAPSAPAAASAWTCNKQQQQDVAWHALLAPSWCLSGHSCVSGA